MKKHSSTGLAVIALILVCASCATQPPRSGRPSPYTVSTHNGIDIGFFASIRPIQMDTIAQVELWYLNKPRSYGQLLEQTGDTVRVAFPCYAGIFTESYAEIHVVTKTGEVHSFDIGDPVVNSGEAFTGTMTSM